MIRPSRFDDAGYVLLVRNLPDVREASLDTREITAEEHARWWADGGQAQTWIIEASCDIYNRFCPAGYIRVSASGVVSIAVVKWARGRGVATTALREVMATCWRLRADVRAGNEASRSLFERCGFRLVRRVDAVDRYEWSAN